MVASASSTNVCAAAVPRFMFKRPVTPIDTLFAMVPVGLGARAVRQPQVLTRPSPPQVSGGTQVFGQFTVPPQPLSMLPQATPAQVRGVHPPRSGVPPPPQ